MKRTARRRQQVSNALLLLTFVLTVIGGPTLYAATMVGDEDAFVAVADRIVASPEVTEAIADTIASVTFETIAADEQLAEVLPEGLRSFSVPLTRIAVDEFTKIAVDILQSEGASDIRGSALREVHGQLTSGNDEVVVDMRAVLVSTAREIGGVAVGSGVAKAVSGTDTGRFVLAEAGSNESKLVSAVTKLPRLSSLIAVASLLTLLLAVAVSVDRPKTLTRAGLALAGGAVLAVFVFSIGLEAALGGLGGGSSIGSAVAEVLSADFAEQQLGAIIVGALLAFVGLLLGDRPSAVILRSLPSDLWHRRPGVPEKLQLVLAENPAFTRAAIWIVGAVSLAVWSMPTKRVVITIIALTVLIQLGAWVLIGTTKTARSWRAQLSIGPGPTAEQPSTTRTGGIRANVGVLASLAFLLWPGWNRSVAEGIFVATGLILALVDFPAAWRSARERQQTSAAADATPTRSRLRYYIAAGVGVAAIVLGAAATASSYDRLAESEQCNGYVELCDRRVDEVVFAGSHNSMSSTDLGWELALQTGDMVAQLDFGVRALLIDALYWDTPPDPDFLEETDTSAIEAALGNDDPQPGAWLCHAFCALGATELTGGLTEIALWMDANPREVLIIIVQDEVSEQDLTDAFVESGLRDLAYVHEPGTPYPRLGELLDAGTRLLVYGENQGEAGTWFQNAWESTFQETPFKFAVESDFTCEPNRGDLDNDLFLINHWVTTGIPVREAAIRVNSRDSLLERVEACREERGVLPTVLAVDFVQTGDLIKVVDELNQVGQ